MCWQSADHQDGAGDDASVNDRSLGDSAHPPLEYDDLWGSRDGEETLVEEEVVYPVTSVPCVTGYGEEGDREWVTFFKPSTGKMLRLPRHTEEEVEERWRAIWACTSLDELLGQDNLLSLWNNEKWRGPGVWTSEDDLLSVRALRIVDIQNVVKKVRVSEGPHW